MKILEKLPWLFLCLFVSTFDFPPSNTFIVRTNMLTNLIIVLFLKGTSQWLELEISSSEYEVLLGLSGVGGGEKVLFSAI